MSYKEKHNTLFYSQVFYDLHQKNINVKASYYQKNFKKSLVLDSLFAIFTIVNNKGSCYILRTGY